MVSPRTEAEANAATGERPISPAAITVDDLKASRLRETTHYNGGKVWFGYGHQGIEYPRLGRIDRYYRKDRSVVSTWMVDGLEVASLEAAAQALNSPPVLTEQEAALLARITTEWGEYRFQGVTEHLMALGRKGLIEAQNGKHRLANAGTSVVQNVARSDEQTVAKQSGLKSILTPGEEA